MYLIFEGKITKREKKYFQSFVEWTLKKYGMADAEISITLAAVPVEEMCGFSALCTQVEPDEYDIEFKQEFSLLMKMISISHEMVHVRQYYNKELAHRMRAGKWTTFWRRKAQPLNEDNYTYWDQPWEIEAHGLEKGQVIQWAMDTGHIKKKWMRESIEFLNPDGDLA